MTVSVADSGSTPETKVQLQFRANQLSEQLALKPDDQILLNNRGRVRLELQDFSGALEDFNRALELSPKDPLLLHRRCNTKKFLDDLSGALDDCNAAIALDPYYENALNTRALIKTQRDDPDGAAADWQKILEINPLNSVAYTNIADYSVRHNHLAVGVEACNSGTRAIERGLHSGVDYSGEDVASKPDLDQFVRFDPQLSTFFGNCAAVKRLSGEPREGIQYAEKALKLNPIFEAAYEERAAAETELGLLDDAIADYTTLIELNPAKNEHFFQRGALEERQGKLHEAADDYEKSAKVNEKSYRSFWAVGNTHYLLGSYDKALANYEKALALQVNNPELLSARGICKMKLDRFEEAEADLLEAIRMKPDLLGALESLIWLKKRKQDWPALRDLYPSFLALTPDNSQNGLPSEPPVNFKRLNQSHPRALPSVS